MSIAAVVIGRNEGARLIACLEALRNEVRHIVYVDSGSDDGSVAAAEARGADVVALDLARPFTAARARNAGIAALPAGTTLVQFLDGDCVMQDGWINRAEAFLADNAEVAVVCGRRREIAPQASRYNLMIDGEWDTPVGEAKACGGDALIRVDALREVGGYRDDLIAGEEPEMCVRLRQTGWKIWRLDAEMTRHDAQITRFGQWWQRAKRAGFAFAQGAQIHGAPPERHWVAETRRALLWGAVLPAAIIFLVLLAGAWALLLILIYPLQILRLSRRGSTDWAVFTVIGRFAEAQGALSYYWRKWRGSDPRLIEYK